MENNTIEYFRKKEKENSTLKAILENYGKKALSGALATATALTMTACAGDINKRPENSTTPGTTTSDIITNDITTTPSTENEESTTTTPTTSVTEESTTTSTTTTSTTTEPTTSATTESTTTQSSTNKEDNAPTDEVPTFKTLNEAVNAYFGFADNSKIEIITVTTRNRVPVIYSIDGKDFIKLGLFISFNNKPANNDQASADIYVPVDQYHKAIDEGIFEKNQIILEKKDFENNQILINAVTDQMKKEKDEENKRKDFEKTLNELADMDRPMRYYYFQVQKIAFPEGVEFITEKINGTEYVAINIWAGNMDGTESIIGEFHLEKDLYSDELMESDLETNDIIINAMKEELARRELDSEMGE